MGRASRSLAGPLGLLALGSLRPELVSSHPALAETLLPTGGLRRVSVLVPEATADGLRRLAREFRTRHRLGMPAGGWRRLSPSAELMVDPESGARCAIRDSRRSGAERYLWTLTVFGYHQLTAGRTGDLAEARSRAEAALASYAATWREMPRDGSGDRA
jgi:hypothetical protein